MFKPKQILVIVNYSFEFWHTWSVPKKYKNIKMFDYNNTKSQKYQYLTWDIYIIHQRHYDTFLTRNKIKIIFE